MLGDLRIAVRQWVREHLLCTHDYRGARTLGGGFTFEECERCGRTKSWNRS